MIDISEPKCFTSYANMCHCLKEVSVRLSFRTWLVSW
uniref:Uncharacterized protein n=1 Tax=Anguilla anguilla TaxID=7936 RepID=A0A0E9QAR9_ANGAN